MSPFKSFWAVSLILIFLGSCRNSEVNLIPESENAAKRELNQEFKDYWYAGVAEITSYELHQERYGILRNGTAVNVFVTESFNPELQVKSDQPSEESISVLKFNKTKKFHTGIYPYSIMASTFNPIQKEGHAVKSVLSVQEWCGQVYTQMNLKNGYDVMSHSYFEKEADKSFNLPETWIEDEIWNLIRIQPSALPTGSFEMIPSLEFSRLNHHQLQAEKAEGNLSKTDSLTTYTVAYPELKRSLRISFTSTFPFTIEAWEETHPNGMVTSALKMARLKTAYWQENNPKFEYLRDSLKLQ